MAFFPALLLLLIALKLTGHVAWSWLWILAPLWLPPLLMFVLAVVVFVVCMIMVNYYS